LTYLDTSMADKKPSKSAAVEAHSNLSARQKIFTKWLNWLLKDRAGALPAYPLKDSKLASYFTDKDCVLMEQLVEAISKRVMSKFSPSEPTADKIRHCLKHLGKEFYLSAKNLETEAKAGVKILKVHVEGDTKNVVYTEKSLLKEELEKLGKKETIGDYVATQLNGKLVDFWDKTMTIENWRMMNNNCHEIKFGPSDIPPSAIAAGDIEMICTMLFRMCIAFQMKTPNTGIDEARKQLLEWCNGQGCKMSNFTEDIKNGEAAVHLVNKWAGSEVIPQKKMGKKNWNLAIAAAEKNLQVPAIMEADDFNGKKIDEQSIMLYFSFFRMKDAAKELDILQQIKQAPKVADAHTSPRANVATIAPISAPTTAVANAGYVAPVPQSASTLKKLHSIDKSDAGNFGCLSRAKLIGKAIAGEEIRLITTPIMNIFQKPEDDFVAADVRVDITPIKGGDVFYGTMLKILNDGGIEVSFRAPEAGQYKVSIFIKKQPVLASHPTITVLPYFDDSYQMV